MIRHLRRISSAILIVRLPDGSQLAVPEWMLNPLSCERLIDEAEPRVAISALVELRQLIDSQPLIPTRDFRSCAQYPTGGQHAQQRESERLAAETSLRGRGGLGHSSGGGPGTLSKPVHPTTGKRSPQRRMEAE
jgi:hypothetical protein